MDRKTRTAIRQRLNDARISQAELARQVGVSQQYISELLSGVRGGHYGAWGAPRIGVRIEEKLGQLEAQRAQKAESA